MRRIRFRLVRREAGSVLMVAAGTLLYALAMKGFIQPNHFLTGGVAGLSLLLNVFTHLPVGLLNLLFNIPIFLLGYRDVGRRFVIYSGLSVLFFWIFADHLPIDTLTREPMLGAIFGGLLIGAGSALALRGGGSLGGFDIVGLVVNRRFSMGIGEFSLFLNAGLTVVSGLMDTPERAMYTLISMFVTSRALDGLQSPKPRKAVLIFSSRTPAIKERILKEMARGASLIMAKGAFSEAPVEALFCVMTRYELREVRDIVRDEDPGAFVTVLEASDVIGRFKRPSAFAIWKRQRSGHS